MRGLSQLFRLPRIVELRWLGRQRVSLVTEDPAVLSGSARLGKETAVNEPRAELLERAAE